MTLVEPSQLLRAFAWARLALAGLLVVVVPYTASGSAPGASVPVMMLALFVAAASSAAILLRRANPGPRRIAAFVSTLDVVLITAVVAGTGGARSIYPFLYVLSVTAASVLLPRAGALAIAASASLLYTGLVFGRTVVPLTYFFEAPQDTTGLEIVTMFMNSATFLVVAIVAGGVAERYRATHQQLETRQRDLRNLEAFRDLVFDSVATGLVVLDADHRITAFNRAATEITGRSGAIVLNAHWRDVAGDALDLGAVTASLEAATARSVRRETTLHRPDGAAVPVSMTFSTLRSADGDPLGIVVACEDLSPIRRMEARMRHADRLATLGRMSANIAHEIRNPLASMTGAIEALTAAGNLTRDEREKLTDIVLRESGRLNRIVSEFLAYARPAPLAPQRTDLAELLDEILVLLQHRPLPPHIKVVQAFEAPLWVEVDPGAVRQAIWNLCLNAVEAMPDGGELVVAATVLHGGARISVTDSGSGIGAGDLGHIFEPFYSTKPEGSGLGLALVHRVARDHGGDVDVRTDSLTGTTFTLTFPSGHA